MRLKIGKLLILVAWGDLYEALKTDYEKVYEKHQLIMRIKEAMNEPSYIKEVKEYIHGGQLLMAVKRYKDATGDGLHDSKIAVYNIRDKMEIDAKK